MLGKTEGKRGDREWDGYIESPTQWTWIWSNSRRRHWRTEEPDVLQSMGSQRDRHDLATKKLPNLEGRYPSAQFSSVAQSCPTLCHPMDCSTPPCPSPTPRACSNSCPSSQWYHPIIHPLSSPSPAAFNFPSINLSQLFHESVLPIRWPKYWSFSFSMSELQEKPIWIQLFNHVRGFVTPWIAACQASLPITNSHSSLRLTSIESVMPSSHLILCRPLLRLPPIPPSIGVFSNESTLCMRWPKYWSFSFSIIPSKEIPGLISFRMDWLHLLAVQGSLKSLLQHHSSIASILRRSAFFTVQLSHPYMTTGKTIALTRRTFVGKVMSLLFNVLSRLVITFLPRSKCLLISWLQSPSAVILEPSKIKSDTVSTVSPSICHEVMGPDAMIFVFWMLNYSSLIEVSALIWESIF